jgi:hypothetical protein
MSKVFPGTDIMKSMASGPRVMSYEEERRHQTKVRLYGALFFILIMVIGLSPLYTNISELTMTMILMVFLLIGGPIFSNYSDKPLKLRTTRIAWLKQILGIKQNARVFADTDIPNRTDSNQVAFAELLFQQGIQDEYNKDLD